MWSILYRELEVGVYKFFILLFFLYFFKHHFLLLYYLNFFLFLFFMNFNLFILNIFYFLCLRTTALAFGVYFIRLWYIMLLGLICLQILIFNLSLETVSLSQPLFLLLNKLFLANLGFIQWFKRFGIILRLRVLFCYQLIFNNTFLILYFEYLIINTYNQWLSLQFRNLNL